MSKQTAFLLKIGDGGDPQVYSTVAGLRTTAMTIEGGRVTISGAGVFTGSGAEARVKANAFSGAMDAYRMAFESGETVTGRFLITRLDYAVDFNGDPSYTLTLQSDGPVAKP